MKAFERVIRLAVCAAAMIGLFALAPIQTGIRADRGPTGELVPFTQRLHLAPDDLDALSRFGMAVAMHANRLTIGAPLDNAIEGSVHVFVRDLGGSGFWGREDVLLPSESIFNQQMGRLVAVDGDTIAAASWRDTTGSNAGRVYIFEHGPGGWIETNIISSPAALEDDKFAWGMALSGDTLAVGAPEDDGSLPDAGTVYLYERDQGGPGTWGLAAQITPVDLAEGDTFGQQIALDGDLLFVSTGTIVTVNFDAPGRVYIFERNLGGPGNWGLRKTITASDSTNRDRFGAALAFSQGTLAVGAYDHSVTSLGAVYIFEQNAGGPDAWEETARLTPSDGHPGDWFGSAVALAGQTLIVGAPFYEDEGAAYVYSRSTLAPGSWIEENRFTGLTTEDGDQFGGALAISEDTFTAGAREEDAIGANSGAAHVFQRGGTFLSGEAYVPFLTNCEILYFDDFSNPNSGWPIVDTGDTLYEYRNGEYRTLVREPFGIAGAIPGVPFDNYLLSADVRNFADKAGTYGLLFGQVSGWTGLYTFEVDNAKHYEIWRWSGSWALLDSGTSPALKPGTASNRLSVERQGDRIRAYANGAFVTEITDSFFTGLKRVGVWATGLGQANLDVRFDNYTVEPIGCGLSAGSLLGFPSAFSPDGPELQAPTWLPLDLPPRGE